MNITRHATSQWLRLFGGLGVHVGRRLRLEVGYMWRYLERRGASPDENDHVLSISVFGDTRRKEAPKPEARASHY